MIDLEIQKKKKKFVLYDFFLNLLEEEKESIYTIMPNAISDTQS